MDILKKYNDFFVTCFNLILKKEEVMLQSIDRRLSVTEIHVLEAVDNAGENNASKNVAAALGISLGTLTTSIHTLLHKGYVEKTKDPTDKRVSRLTLTEKGKKANETHIKFHKQMIKELLENLDEAESEALLSSLIKIKNFLGEKKFEN